MDKDFLEMLENLYEEVSRHTIEFSQKYNVDFRGDDTLLERYQTMMDYFMFGREQG